MKLALAIVVSLAGSAFALMLFVLVVAGAANTKPEDWPMIRLMLWATAGGGVACLGVAVWLMTAGRFLTATAIGGLPVAVFFGLMIYASVPS